jgi:hypothetical protein
MSFSTRRFEWPRERERAIGVEIFIDLSQGTTHWAEI